jgi:hypothetical protein
MFKDMMTSRTFLRVFVGCAAFLGASCKDGSGPKPPGPPSQLVLVSTTAPGAFANTDVTTPVQISVRDANGTGLPNQTVTFVVMEGGGTLAGQTAVSDANGTATMATWHLGKFAAPINQIVRASIGSVTLDITATVVTSYNIVVRFFGSAMTVQQQQLFFNAAGRISGFITGDVIDADARSNLDLQSNCNVSGQPPLNEIIDDVIIYASIQAIDGPGKILAQAGPCLYRTASQGGPSPGQPAVGVMNFDSADIQTLSGAGSFQEVITHEMMHVLGFGVIWEQRGFLSGKGTLDPRYTGPLGRAGCVAVGGTVTCANSIPLENMGGAGTVESHWREVNFDNELMTGFIDQSPNPLSVMTIGQFADLGYTVNNADSDSYTIPGGLIQALRSNNPSLPDHPGWEQLFQTKDLLLLDHGRVRAVRRK